MWQVNNRGIQDEEPEFLKFLQRLKLDVERTGLDWLHKQAGWTEDDWHRTESELYKRKKREWDRLQAWREDDWFWLREDDGRGGFPDTSRRSNVG